MEIFPILERRNKLSAKLWYVLPTDNGVQIEGGVGSKVVSRDSHVFVTCGARPDRSFGHIYSFSLDTFILRKLKSEVPARYEHSAAVDDKDNIVIFGGADQTGNRNDLQIVDTREDKVTSSPSTATTPTPRTLHNCGLDPARGLLWVWGGGHLGNAPVQDTHLYTLCLETRDWTKYSSSGEVPSARHGHVVCHVTDKVYIHGGMEGGSVFSDLYVTDVANPKESCEWTKLAPVGKQPCARAAHSAAQHHHKMFLFGGFTGTHALDDLWVFDTDSGAWDEVVVEAPRPHPRLDLTMCTARLPVKDNSEEPEPPSSATPPTNPTTFHDITPLLHAAAETETPEGPVVELPVSEHQDVIVLFGGMDLEGNIYNDIYLIQI